MPHTWKQRYMNLGLVTVGIRYRTSPVVSGFAWGGLLKMSIIDDRCC
jgi:hypothetical protein